MDLMTIICKILLVEIYFFISKKHYINKLASLKNVQATGEISSPLNRASCISHSSFLWVFFVLLDPDADPDPADQNQRGSATLEKYKKSLEAPYGMTSQCICYTHSEVNLQILTFIKAGIDRVLK